eukprot:scaffold2395_cov290-Prasinococcus_capsulatus_cf.AAC.2
MWLTVPVVHSSVCAAGRNATYRTIVPQAEEAEDLAVVVDKLLEAVSVEHVGRSSQLGLHEARQVVVSWLGRPARPQLHNQTVHPFVTP